MTVSSSSEFIKKSSSEDVEPPVVDVAARGLGIRHVQAIVMGVSSCMAYSLRITLSVAVVAMVNHKGNTGNGTQAVPELAPTYDWDEKTQGVVLSSFFWGYFIMQLPAGILVERYGGHRLLCIAILGSSFLTILLPPCAYLGTYMGDYQWLLVCFNRMLQGLIQSFSFPSLYALLGVWSPPSELGLLSGIASGGAHLGAVIATPISGFLVVAYGWPSIFYFFGATGMLIGLIAIFFGADSPGKHRMISEAEKHYIQSLLGGEKVQRGVPWKNLLTSKPVLATIVSMSLINLVFFTFFTKIPTYLDTVLHFDMESNGVLSALPYFVAWLLIFFFCWLCDFIVDRGWMGLTSARKLFNSIGHVGAAVCVILMSHAKTGAMAVFLLTSFMGVQTAVFPGVQANFMDVAPNYSGTIYSIANFFSAFLGILGPIGVGLIVTESGSVEQWRIVLYLSAAILCFGNMIFIIWSTTETQPWNWPERRDGELPVGKPKKNIEINL